MLDEKWCIARARIRNLIISVTSLTDGTVEIVVFKSLTKWLALKEKRQRKSKFSDKNMIILCLQQ